MSPSDPSPPQSFPVWCDDGTRLLAYDVGPEGMYLRSPHRLEVGQELALELRPAGLPVAITASGVVVLVNDDDGPAALVRFTDLRIRSNR